MTVRVAVAAAMLVLASRAHASLCSGYMMLVEENELIPAADVKRWGEYALKAEGLFAEQTPCAVYVNITAMKTVDDALWAAYAAISERMYLGSGFIVLGAEHGSILTVGKSHRTQVGPIVRNLLEQFISDKVKATPSFEPALVRRELEQKARRNGGNRVP